MDSEAQQLDVKYEVVNPAAYNGETMSLPCKICFFYGGWGMRECRNKVKKTEVSRSHSSEEVPVMGMERRAESLIRGVLFEVVKVTKFEKTKRKQRVAAADESDGRTKAKQPPVREGVTRMV